MLTMLGSGGERGPVILPAFKAGDPDSVGVVGSTPTRFRQGPATAVLLMTISPTICLIRKQVALRRRAWPTGVYGV